MRTLQLTHSQIELIIEALSEAYLNRLDTIETNRKYLTSNAVSDILDKANTIDSLSVSIKQGELDK